MAVLRTCGAILVVCALLAVGSGCAPAASIGDPDVSDTTGFGGEDGGPGDPELENNKSLVEPRGAAVNTDAVGAADRSGSTIDAALWPVVLAVQATQAPAGGWRFDVTLSSPYDTPDRYADAWRVLDEADNELGIRVLAHDHASEQPFTRSLDGIAIPSTASTVFVEGRDQDNGWSGQRFEVLLGK